MNIRILQESDAESYQKLRLDSLIVNSEAFGSTYERESKFSIETFAERLKPTKDKFVLGAFTLNGSLVGIVTYVRESGLKTAHKGNIFGMYVSPEMRGKGLGKTLLLELIKWARDHDGLEQINLMVVSNNNSAKKLYKSVGFEVYGTERNALKFKGQYYDEDLMVFKL
ncbi:GNAT family N-acetyltransferase [Paenibacillus psychroresistens]|uniref:GNAT family N-acetyltransferase n=1 Tax=Paenibacillus psychroresistens TaxID=1778678 RepID=A0A6B8RRM9_9BACL|nr:GNAT family protein [Paenibacillus psychroresistens]QGQ98046.1 GNAT family N-acetyltransferase [Paenibacillus psychroresistens]